MKNLSNLDLLNHKIKFLPEDVFLDLKKLTNLRLNGNQIEKLPKNIFSENLILNFVSFGDNRLTHLDEEIFKNNLHLEWIRFYDNKLKIIAVNFTQLRFIKTIDLRKNACVDHYFGDGQLPTGTKAESVEDLQYVISDYCQYSEN